MDEVGAYTVIEIESVPTSVKVWSCAADLRGLALYGCIAYVTSTADVSALFMITDVVLSAGATKEGRILRSS